MTQPAKVQEPSMEEILASIRRIIADDEAKPAGCRQSRRSEAAGQAAKNPPQAAAPAAKPPAMKDIPPSALPPRKRPPQGRPRRSPPAPPPPAARTAATNSQDDIDAMLAGLDEATSEAEIQASRSPTVEVFELTDEMAVPDPRRRRSPRSTRSNRRTISNSPKPPPPGRCIGSPTFEPPPFESPAAPPPQQILSRSTVSAVESAFNTLANTVLSNNARTLEDLVKEMLRPMLKSWLDDNLPGLVERIVKAEIERVSRGR